MDSSYDCAIDTGPHLMHNDNIKLRSEQFNLLTEIFGVPSTEERGFKKKTPSFGSLQ